MIPKVHSFHLSFSLTKKARQPSVWGEGPGVESREETNFSYCSFILLECSNRIISREEKWLPARVLDENRNNDDDESFFVFCSSFLHYITFILLE